MFIFEFSIFVLLIVTDKLVLDYVSVKMIYNHGSTRGCTTKFSKLSKRYIAECTPMGFSYDICPMMMRGTGGK